MTMDLDFLPTIKVLLTLARSYNIHSITGVSDHDSRYDVDIYSVCDKSLKPITWGVVDRVEDTSGMLKLFEELLSKLFVEYLNACTPEYQADNGDSFYIRVSDTTTSPNVQISITNRILEDCPFSGTI